MWLPLPSSPSSIVICCWSLCWWVSFSSRCTCVHSSQLASSLLIFPCPLQFLVSNLHISWNTVGCSLYSSEDQLGLSPMHRGSGLYSYLSCGHLLPPTNLDWGKGRVRDMAFAWQWQIKNCAPALGAKGICDFESIRGLVTLPRELVQYLREKLEPHAPISLRTLTLTKDSSQNNVKYAGELAKFWAEHLK